MKAVTSEELELMMSNGDKILLDFYAEWCGPCKALIPRLEILEPMYENVKFIKLNVDENQTFAIKKGIRSVPTVMFLNGHSVINTSTGIQSDNFYKDILTELNK
jgi:thioredoxin 1